MKKFFALLVSAAVMFVGAVVVAPTASASQADVHRLVNQERARLGLGAIPRNAQMDAVAQEWAEHLLATNEFYHNPNFGRQIPGHWIRASENAAAGFTSVSDLVRGWMESPGHRANIVGAWTHTGVGYARGEGRIVLIQIFAVYSGTPGQPRPEPPAPTPTTPAPTPTPTTPAPTPTPTTPAPTPTPTTNPTSPSPTPSATTPPATQKPTPKPTASNPARPTPTATTPSQSATNPSNRPGVTTPTPGNNGRTPTRPSAVTPARPGTTPGSTGEGVQRFAPSRPSTSPSVPGARDDLGDALYPAPSADKDGEEGSVVAPGPDGSGLRENSPDWLERNEVPGSVKGDGEVSGGEDAIHETDDVAATSLKALNSSGSVDAWLAVLGLLMAGGLAWFVRRPISPPGD